MSDVQLPRVLVVGMGGLGCPVAWILARSRAAHLVLLDDDVVDLSNLGRQILFDEIDVGRPKIEAARDKLLAQGLDESHVSLVSGRLLPDTARALIGGCDLVVEGTDNFASKFLAADAAFLEGVPIVHGAALGWGGTAFCVAAQGAPCCRCVFEDLPVGSTANCNSHGVMGPAVGYVGAVMADFALSYLRGKAQVGRCTRFDGLSGHSRSTQLGARSDCMLCGEHPQIITIEEQRYTRQFCAA